MLTFAMSASVGDLPILNYSCESVAMNAGPFRSDFNQVAMNAECSNYKSERSSIVVCNECRN